jgi:hypothetical protein
MKIRLPNPDSEQKPALELVFSTSMIENDGIEFFKYYIYYIIYFFPV